MTRFLKWERKTLHEPAIWQPIDILEINELPKQIRLQFKKSLTRNFQSAIDFANRALALSIFFEIKMTRTTKPLRLKCAEKATRKGVVIASAAKDSHLIEMKQQQIVDKASKIFFDKGFHPTTIRMIAKASGMSMGQLYHYISSKDDVLYLVHENLYKGLRKHLTNSENIRDPVEKLIAALRHTLEFITENRKLVQFAYSESKYLRKKYLQAVLEMYTQNTICFWRQLLEELNRRKRLKVDLDFASSLIVHQTGFLALSGWTLKDKPLNESINFLIEFILRGLGLSIDQ